MIKYIDTKIDNRDRDKMFDRIIENIEFLREIGQDKNMTFLEINTKLKCPFSDENLTGFMKNLIVSFNHHVEEKEFSKNIDLAISEVKFQKTLEAYTK